MIDYVELPPIPMRICACFDERTYLAEIKRLDVQDAPAHWLVDDAPAAVHFLEGSHGDIVALMCFDAKTAQARGVDGLAVAALLCHEAVHVMQECRRWMREKTPGSEWEAYTVQFIAQRFMVAYVQHCDRG